jgi:hypothetical protein
MAAILPCALQQHPKPVGGTLHLPPTFISALVREGHGAQALPPVVHILPLIHCSLGAPAVLALTAALPMLHLALIRIPCRCVQHKFT